MTLASVAASAIKTGARSADNVTSGYKTVSNVLQGTADVATLLKRVDIKNYAKIFGKTAPALKGSSGLVDTGKAVKKLAGAVPPSTDDLLTSIDTSTLKRATDKLSGLTETAKVDPSALANMKSLDKLNNASEAVTKTAKIDGFSTIARRSEKVLANGDKYKALSRATAPVKKADDVGDVLKKSKGVASKVDDVAEAGAKVAKKSSKKIDDAVDGAQTLSKSKKALAFAKRWSAVANVAVMASFYLGMYISNKMNESKDGSDLHDTLVSDPASDAYPVSKYDESDIHVQVDDQEITLSETLQRKEILVAIVATMILVAAL